MNPLTRFPDDPEYVARLGAAVYAFAYLEALLQHVFRLLEPTANRRGMAELTSGGLRWPTQGGARRSGLAPGG